MNQPQAVPQVQPVMPPGPPGQMQPFAPPAPIPGCPPGLEYLAMLDQVLVRQQIELLEGDPLLNLAHELQNKSPFRFIY